MILERASTAVPLTLITSLAAPPTTTLKPAPISISSISSGVPAVALSVLINVLSLPSTKTSNFPSSPWTKFLPPPTLIISAPKPAMTLLTPSDTVMTSSAPAPRLVDSIRRNSPLAKNSALPSSPKIVLFPACEVISSSPAPPITTFVPAVNVIRSLSPKSKSLLSMLSRSEELVCKVIFPLSPITKA